MWKQGNHFVSLSSGRCHVRVDGPSRGTPLLLIHGATVPGWEFERIIPYLKEAGFRVVCPDLFGHGDSDRPDTRYDTALFVRQLEDLLYALSFDQRVHLLGHSLGCVIAAHLVVRNARYYGNVAFVAPMLDFASERRAMRVLELPVVGEALMHAYALPMLVRRRRRGYRHIENGQFPARFEAQLRVPGFGRALLSLIRSGILGDQSDCYRLLDSTANSIGVFRGSDDGIFSGAQLDRLRNCITRARIVEIEGTPHSVLLTHPERIAPLLTGFFLQSHSAACWRSLRADSTILASPPDSAMARSARLLAASNSPPAN